LKPLKNGDEEKFEIALNSEKVKDCTLESLKEILRLIMMKVGVRGNNLPTDEEKAVLLSHIVSEYGNHTHQEILLAFDMAITGKLDIDAKCYENFTCLYFSQILNAYRVWASVTYKQKIAVLQPPPPQIIYTDEENIQYFREVTEGVYQSLLKGIMNYLPKRLMTEILTYDGLLKNEDIDIFLARMINSGVKKLYEKIDNQLPVQ
jgi:hypothetical protein